MTKKPGSVMSVSWHGAFEGYFICILNLLIWNLSKFLHGNIVFKESINMRKPLLAYSYFSLGGKLILVMKPACRRAGVSRVTHPHRLSLLSGAAKGHASLYTG